MKIASIVGARPNFVKLAPLSKELRKSFKEIIIHTGQHYDYELNRIFFDELRIPAPNYHLNVGSGTHGFQTSEMIKKIESILIEEKPDLILSFGDTNTTLAGALAAVKLNIKIAHVEAGLRSYDKKMPEEINRILVDHCSDMLFCPTKTAVENLKKENIVEDVYLTGDVMVDSLNYSINIAESRSNILEKLNIKSYDYILATIHRADNTDNSERLNYIVSAFCEIENLVFPCHPRTKIRLKNFGLWDKLKDNVQIIEPIGYFDMLILEKNAKMIITDSGGVQKEAYILGVPSITLRENTEWVETLDDGWNLLTGVKKDKILIAVRDFKPKHNRSDVFGKGDASKNIARIIAAQ